MLFRIECNIDSASIISCRYLTSASKSAFNKAFSLSATVIQRLSRTPVKTNELDRWESLCGVV